MIDFRNFHNGCPGDAFTVLPKSTLLKNAAVYFILVPRTSGYFSDVAA